MPRPASKKCPKCGAPMVQINLPQGFIPHFVCFLAYKAFWEKNQPALKPKPGRAARPAPTQAEAEAAS